MDWLKDFFLLLLSPLLLLNGGGQEPQLGATPILQVFQGGTGSSTLTGILYGTGTSSVRTVTIGNNLTFSNGTLSATAGGTGTVSTSTVPTVGQLAYWTSNGYPSLLGSVATGTLAATSPLSVTAGRSVIGGSATLTIATTTNSLFTGTGGQVLGYTAAGWTGVATTTFSGGLTYASGNVTADLGTSIDISAETNLTAGDALTLTDDDIDFDGGASPGGELGGTWASPTVDAEIFALDELTDVGAITENYGDLLGWNGSSWADFATSTLFGAGVPAGYVLMASGGVWTPHATATCVQITGSADLCDGSDATGGGSGGGTFSTTTSQTAGILINYPNNDDDIVAIGANSTTTAELILDPNTSTITVGTGGAGDSTARFGPNFFNWIMGFDDTDDSFAISSSTALGTTNALTIAKSTLATTLAGSLTVSGTNFIFGGDTFDELVGDGLDIASGDLIFDCSDVVGTGLQCTGEDLVLNATGDWTGTVDGNNFAGGAIATGELLYGGSAGSLAELAAGTGGRVLAMSGGLPAWVATTTFSGGLTYAAGNVTADLGTSIDLASAEVTGDLPFANLAQVSANSVLGNNTGATADARSVATSTLFGAGLTGGHVLGVTNGAWGPMATATCVQITGSAGLCDGDDASGGAGASFGQAWEVFGAGGWIAPTSTIGVIVSASSTIGNAAQNGGLTIHGGATTTGMALIQNGLALGNTGTVTTTPLFINDNTASNFGAIIQKTSGSGSPAGLFVSVGQNSTNYVAAFAQGSFAAPNYKFVVQGSGLVGIGDGTPEQILSIDGTNPQVLIEESTTEFLRAGVGETAEQAVIGWDDSDSLQLGVYSSPTDNTIASLVSITSTGLVGIATTTPEARLDVWGASGGKIATFFTDTGTKILEALNTGVVTLLGTWDFGGATSLEVPNGASPTVDAIGEIALDTTSGQLLIATSTDASWPIVIPTKLYPAFSYSTTSWSGTTTIPLGPAFVAETWHNLKCFTDAGTLNVSIYDGTNRMTMAAISTTVAAKPLTTNNTFTADEKRYVDIGTPASSPKQISCTVEKSITRD